MQLPVTHSEVQVRFFDTDALGHLSSSAYFQYMEIGRTDFFMEIAKTETVPVTAVVNINIDYLREALFSDSISVVSWCSRVGNKSMKVSHEIYAGETLAARASATVAGFDTKTRTGCVLPRHWQVSEYPVTAGSN